MFYGLWAVWHCVVSGVPGLAALRLPGNSPVLRPATHRHARSRQRQQFYLSPWQFALRTGNIREGPD